MEEAKAQRLERERVDLITKRQKLLISLLEAYCRTRDANEIIPKVGDVVLMPPFAAILESDSEVVVTTHSFADAMHQLPDLCAKWRQEKDEFLLSLLPAPVHNANIKSPKKLLELATTLFECKACYQPISYPRILSHKCLTDDSWAWRMGKEIRQYSSMSHFPWNFGGVWLVYHEEGAKYAAEVLKACNMNPAATTAEEMDSRNMRFVCECEYAELIRALPDIRHFMDWRKAVRVFFLQYNIHVTAKYTLILKQLNIFLALLQIEHAIKRHPGLIASWTVTNDNERAIDELLLRSMHPADKEMLDQIELSLSKEWSCRRCVAFQGTLADIKIHLRNAFECLIPFCFLVPPTDTLNSLQPWFDDRRVDRRTLFQAF
jgi:hypothetical protein